MAVLTIRKYGDPLLRRRAAPVGEITPEIRKLVDDMIDTMYDELGIGLAAPQVGAPLRLIVISDDETREARALVNPAIVETAGEATLEEGCLSIPGVFALVTRAAWVRAEARDLDGRPVTIEAHALRARVLQHEIDHLDGVLFIDRLDPVTRDHLKRKIKKGRLEETPHRAFAL